MNTFTLLLIGGGIFVISLMALVAAVSTPQRTPTQVALERATRAAREPAQLPGEDAGPSATVTFLARLGTAITPSARIARLTTKIELAGMPKDTTLPVVFMAKFLGAVGLPIGGFVWVMLFPPARGVLLGSPVLFLLVLVSLAALGYFLPEIRLNSMIEDRVAESRRMLADTVDMLSLTLAAGLGFDAALKLVADNTRGALSDELKRVVRDIAYGQTRAESLTALADRTPNDDLKRFCLTCVQADQRGTPLSDILSIQSRELRIKRRQLAEEKAQQVPVKILFPLMLFVLPTLLGVVMSPAIYQMVTEGFFGG